MSNNANSISKSSNPGPAGMINFMLGTAHKEVGREEGALRN